METIFDHNPTEEELYEFIGTTDKKEYMSSTSQDSAYMKIAFLYYYRGKINKARKYVKMIENCNLVNSFWRTVKHP